MTKRLLWVLVFVAPVLIIAMGVWHRHNFLVPQYQAAPLDRNTVDSTLLKGEEVSRNITAQEFTDATNVLVQERQIWSHLDGMSADINIEFDGSDTNHLSLEGTVQLHRLDLSPHDKWIGILARYEMILSDKQGRWTVKTDGTSEKTVIKCQDPQMLEVIKTIKPESVLHMLTFPQYFLATLYRDNLYPQAKEVFYTFDQILKIWTPWVVTNAAPHSYTFWDAKGSQQILDAVAKAGLRTSYTSDYRSTYPTFTFMNGHLYSIRRMVVVFPGKVFEEKMAVYFEKPVESNGFWYPTVFRITPAPTPWPYPKILLGLFFPEGSLARGGQLCVTLSNVSLNVK